MNTVRVPFSDKFIDFQCFSEKFIDFQCFFRRFSEVFRRFRTIFGQISDRFGQKTVKGVRGRRELWNSGVNSGGVSGVDSGH